MHKGKSKYLVLSIIVEHNDNYPGTQEASILSGYRAPNIPFESERMEYSYNHPDFSFSFVVTDTDDIKFHATSLRHNYPFSRFYSPSNYKIHISFDKKGNLLFYCFIIRKDGIEFLYEFDSSSNFVRYKKRYIDSSNKTTVYEANLISTVDDHLLLDKFESRRETSELMTHIPEFYHDGVYDFSNEEFRTRLTLYDIVTF